jgi:hypothetical protein
MALDPIIEKIDSLPKDIQAHYEKTEDGKFRLAVNEHEGWALENIAGLRTTLQDQKTRHDKAQASLKAFEGLDATKAREALALIESGKLKGDDAINAIKKELEAKLAEKDGVIQKYQGEIRGGKLNSALGEAMQGRKEFAPEVTPVIRDMLAQYIGVDADGKIGVWNADKTAFRLTGKGSDYSAAMSPREFVDGVMAAAASGKKLDAAYGLDAAHFAMLPALMLPSAKGTGGGAMSGPASSGGMTREAFGKMSLTAKAQAVKANPALRDWL